MQKLKTFLTVIGAVTVLVLAANSAVYAATGGKFILGKTNKAAKVSTLKRTTSGSALNLVTRSSSNAPLTTNGKGKVTNLNSDSLDGHDSSYFAHIVAYGQVNADGTAARIYGPATPAKDGAYYTISVPGAWPGCLGAGPVITLTPWNNRFADLVSASVYTVGCSAGTATFTVQFTYATDTISDAPHPASFWFTVLR
jgi:hypothetical protein